MPKPHYQTRNALNAIPGAKTDRSKCVALNLSLSWRGTIGRIRNGFAVSLEKENEVRLRLGLPLLAPTVIAAIPCPSCAARGKIENHANGLDCHNKPVIQAVVLAPGETVRRQGTQRKRRNYWRPCLPAALTPQQRAQVLEFAAMLEGQR